MYLLPTEREMNALWHQINPTAQIMDFLYSRPPAKESMAEFFLESEDVELAMEDDAMSFDEIEDDIINMRRDINGFRIQPPRYLENTKGGCPVNFNGWTFKYPRGLRANCGFYEDYAGIDLGEEVEWDDI